MSVTGLITQLITLIELDLSPQLRHIVVPETTARTYNGYIRTWSTVCSCILVFRYFYCWQLSSLKAAKVEKVNVKRLYVYEESREEKSNTLGVFAKSRVWLGLLSEKSIHIQLQVAGHSLCNFAQRTLISILTVILGLRVRSVD